MNVVAHHIDPLPPVPGLEGAELADYWLSLIAEDKMAVFLNLSPRTMQTYRQKGGGPRFVQLSARCIKYRRIEGYQWSEARLRNSTAEYETA